jgi:uncharacterized protein
MEENIKKCECGDNCKCDENCKCGCQCGWKKWLKPKYGIIVLAITALTAIVIVSILRDRIVNQQQNQVSVTGRGKVSYQPDTATINLGLQVDKAVTAEAALNQLNDKMSKIVAGVEALGINKEDVRTEAYNISPQYDYKDGTSTISGFGANQQIEIKVKNIQENPDLVSSVISAAGAAGTNQISGINFSVSDLNGLKQQARILAIKDAREKSAGLAAAAGVKLGKIEGWYENLIQPLEGQAQGGYGGSDMASSVKAAPSPQVPSGSEEVIVEVSLNYEVR